MNNMVSVAMKAGTSRIVTRKPLMRPIATPRTRHQITAVERSEIEALGAKRLKNVAVRPKVEPTERSSSLLTSTKVMPTAITP